MDYYDKAYFQSIKDSSYISALEILPVLFGYYPPRSIVDVGCGAGAWLKACQDLGVSRILGLDGEYVDCSLLMVDRDHFQSCDLSNDILLDEDLIWQSAWKSLSISLLAALTGWWLT